MGKWADLSYIAKIKYDEKSFGPETAEGTIQLKTNIQARINVVKTKFESKKFKNSVEAQKK
ncbi:hypothetical protein [Mesoplasma melaleucae]|uniref:hypothetical protein n=1 Tax=Mesoplasma melaleucae TaxID=81459 RepID=UPI000487960C|nr:hypothetical protein [Mesoplasma melaleucae]